MQKVLLQTLNTKVSNTRKMNKNLLLALSLGFVLSGCASMVPERTTAVKRATETKEYEVSTKDLITASIGTFQDCLLYTSPSPRDDR